MRGWLVLNLIGSIVSFVWLFRKVRENGHFESLSGFFGIFKIFSIFFRASKLVIVISTWCLNNSHMTYEILYSHIENRLYEWLGTHIAIVFTFEKPIQLQWIGVNTRFFFPAGQKMKKWIWETVDKSGVIHTYIWYGKLDARSIPLGNVICLGVSLV